MNVWALQIEVFSVVANVMFFVLQWAVLHCSGLFWDLLHICSSFSKVTASLVFASLMFFFPWEMIMT